MLTHYYYRLYYFNGQLYCTGYKDKSGCCLKGAYLQVQTSSETNSVVDLHDNQEVPGSAKTTAAQRLNSENSFVTNPENVSIFGEKNEYLENIGEEPYSEEDQRFSSWLSVPHWLSGPVYDEKCHASELGVRSHNSYNDFQSLLMRFCCQLNCIICR